MGRKSSSIMILRHNITPLFPFILKFVICSIWWSVFSSAKELKHVCSVLHAYPVLALFDIACSWEERFVSLLLELVADEEVDVSVLVNYVFS